VEAFQTATQGWQAGLFDIAFKFFAGLAFIDLAASMIILIMSAGGRPDWSETAFTVIRWLIPVGLFLWLMQHGTQYAGNIIDSLRQAANAAGGVAITPSAVLTAGINAATTTWTQFASFFHPITMGFIFLACLVIVICYCFMATWMASALIEGYFVIGSAALLLAFGGMRWTREIAVALLRFCLGIGMKLFAMSMVVAVGNTFVQQWTLIPAGVTIQSLFVIVGASIFFAAMAKIVPDTMQRVILAAPVSLSHYHQAHSQAAGTAALAVAPVLGVAGGAALAVQSFRYAAEQMASNGQSSQSNLGRMGQMAGGIGRGLASAAGSEISGRLGGIYRGGASASIARMASSIAQSRRVAAAQQARPQPPQPPPSNNP
jgi:type IV secretion system protein TrbL